MMRRLGFRVLLTAAFASVLCWSALAGSGKATAEPRISVTPGEGPMGTQLTISGQGFQPGEGIFLEILPVGAPHPYRIGNISAESTGEFVVNAELGIVYPGPDVPDPAPPGQGQRVNHAPGDHQIMAYPESLGGRTLDTIAQAPKVSFKVTASPLPSTGGQPGSNQQDLPIELAVGLLLVLIGVVIWKRALISS